MMEGVTGEAASLAGHLKLSNLCWIYDNDRITTEGGTSVVFSIMQLHHQPVALVLSRQALPTLDRDMLRLPVSRREPMSWPRRPGETAGSLAAGHG